jgi:hypothetical protein
MEYVRRISEWEDDERQAQYGWLSLHILSLSKAYPGKKKSRFFFIDVH